MFGCDLNERAMAEARERCAGVAEIFVSSPAAMLERGPFDLIAACNVLCRTPQTDGLEDISAVFPFEIFESLAIAIDVPLSVGGYLVAVNTFATQPTGLESFQRNTLSGDACSGPAGESVL